MADTIKADTLKEAMKGALIEVLNERRDLIQDVVVEALEDFALTEAIKDGQGTETVSREYILDILEGKT